MRIFLFTPLFNLLIIFIWLILPLDSFLSSLSLFNNNGDGYSIVGLGGRLQVFASNPNILAVQTCIAYAVALPILFKGGVKGIFKRTAFLFYLIMLIVMIIWSGSRAALLSILFVSMLFIFNNARSVAYSLFSAIVLVFFVVFVWSLMSMHGSEFEILSRFSSQEDGRLFIWSYYIDLILDNFF